MKAKATTRIERATGKQTICVHKVEHHFGQPQLEQQNIAAKRWINKIVQVADKSEHLTHNLQEQLQCK